MRISARGRRFRFSSVSPGAAEGAGTAGLSPEEALEDAVKSLKGFAGLAGWEIFMTRESGISIEAREGKVESLVSAGSFGMAIRVMAGGRIGFAFLNQGNRRDIAEAISRARLASGFTGDDPFTVFPGPPERPFAKLDIFDPRIAEVPREQKIARALAIENAAMSHDPRLKTVRGARYEEHEASVWVVNSRGLTGHDHSTQVSASVEAVAEEGEDAQGSYEFETAHHYDRLDPSRVGREAARKAVALLGAGKGPKGTIPVVLAPEAAAGLISVLSASAGGDAVDKKRSWLAGKLGQRVASSAVSIIDDGTLAEGPEAFPFDDEGTPSQRTTVIRDGVLESLLYNIYYGRKAGKGSSGNGIRTSLSAPPVVETTNWVLLPGKSSVEDLIRKADRGMLIVELIGLHTADPATGEFSLGANGFCIEKGRVAGPVTGAALAGELGELLGGIIETSDEVKFFGETAAPAALVESMDIS